MNLQLLKQYIENHTYMDSINPKLEKDNSNIKMFFTTAVHFDRKWLFNHGGWPLSDIAEINNAATIEEQKALLSRLETVGSDLNKNAGLSDAEIMLSHKSKYLQAADEKISWLQGQIEIRDAKRAEVLRNLQAAKAEKLAKQKASAEALAMEAAKKAKEVDSKIIDGV